MELKTIRYNTEKTFSDGLFFINNKFQCHTIEDGHKDVKVKGETRIPDGRYEVTLRKEGGFHGRYLKEYGASFHKGMLWVRNVPNFEYILIHVGNSAKDTEGCLLVGMTNSADEAGFIGGSKIAYRKIYPIIAKELEAGRKVFITYQTI
jgi:hypothetical protein